VQTAASIRRGRLSLTLALLLSLAAALLVTLGVRPALADTTPMYTGTQWLGGNGVNVCAPSTDGTCGGQAHVGGVSSNWWQCVELAQRLYYDRGWYTANGGLFAGVNYAYQIWDNASSLGMSTQAQGSITSIIPGDMIVYYYSSTDTGGYGSSNTNNVGHVAVVNSVLGSTVTAMEQNFYGTADEATYTLSGGTLIRTAPYSGSVNNVDGYALPLEGIVHSPLNNYPVLPSSPTVSFDGKMYVFALGTDNKVYVNSWNGSWSGFTSLGSDTFAGSPAAVPEAVAYDGNLYVFALKSSGEIWYDKLSGGTWGGFSSLETGADFSSNPTVVQYGAALGVYAVGTDGQMYGDSLDGSWSNFGVIGSGAYFEGNPAAITRYTDSGSGDTVLVAEGTNNEYYWTKWSGSGWSTWSNIDSSSTFANPSSTSPTYPSYGPSVGLSGSSVYVFGRGTNNEIYADSWNGSSWSTAFSNIASGATFEYDPAELNFDGILQVLGTGTDEHVYNNYLPSGGWAGFSSTDSSSDLGSEPSAIIRGSHYDVFALGTDGKMYDNSWTGSAWTGFTGIAPSDVFAAL
jgi:hypothetical protein